MAAGRRSGRRTMRPRTSPGRLPTGCLFTYGNTLLLHPAPSIRISSSDSLRYGSIRLVSKTEIHGLAYMSEEEEMSLERQEISDNKPELTVDYLSVNTEKRNFVT